MTKYDPNGYHSRQQVLDAMENARKLGKAASKDKKKGDSPKGDTTPLKSSPTKPEEA